MVEKYFNNVVPESNQELFDDKTTSLVSRIDGLFKIYSEKMESFEFSQALENVWNVVKMANKLVEDEAPWNLHKNEKQKELANVLYVLLEVIRVCSLAIQPVMPETSQKIWQMLNLNYVIDGFDVEKEIKFGIMEPGSKVNKAQILFPRIIDEKR